MRIIVCERNRMLSDALCVMLGRRGHEVVARPSTPDDSVMLAELQHIDLWLVGNDPAEGPGCPVAELRRLMPAMKIVAFVAAASPSALRQTAIDGADGITLRSEGVRELDRMIRLVHAHPLGRQRTSVGRRAQWSKGASAALARPAVDVGRDTSGLSSLTTREREVIDQLASGHSTTGIARNMGVGVSTVRTHLQHVYSKLGVHSRLELVAATGRLQAPLRIQVAEAS